MYILVTGAAGFIGSHLARRLINNGEKIIAVDCFLNDLYPAEIKRQKWRELSTLGEDHIFLEKDLRYDSLDELKDFPIDRVVNLAAMPGLSANWSQAAVYYECNLIGLNRLLDVLAKNRHCRTFVQASTSSVYGEIAIGDETGAINPISPYGISKMAAEKLIEVYSKLTNIDFRILRLFSVYGPNQRPDMAYSKIIESIRNNSEFHVYGSGEQLRSNTYIDDVIDAIVSAIQVDVCPKIINICGDETRSLLDAIAIIESIMKRKAKIRFLPSRKGDQKETRGSNEKAKESLKWKPMTEFYDGISKQIG